MAGDIITSATPWNEIISTKDTKHTYDTGVSTYGRVKFKTKFEIAKEEALAKRQDQIKKHKIACSKNRKKRK